jgi:hypothetical protein
MYTNPLRSRHEIIVLYSAGETDSAQNHLGNALTLNQYRITKRYSWNFSLHCH